MSILEQLSLVGVYGLAYWIAGSDPMKYWPLVAVRNVGKTFGPIGFATGLLKVVFFWKSAPMFLFSDLIWWWPFWAILLRAWRSDPHTLRRFCCESLHHVLVRGIAGDVGKATLHCRAGWLIERVSGSANHDKIKVPLKFR